MRHVYQSPKTKLLSTPVDVNDTARRGVLESMGWQIVQTIEDAPVVELSDPNMLPLDIACRELLQEAGIFALDTLREALPQLHTLKGIGPKRAARVREFVEAME